MKTTQRIFVFFFYLCSQAYAQLDTLLFEKYSVAEGLSDNVVNSIIQDEEGYIWIGTVNGLNRFDGDKFQNHYQAQKPLLLPGSYIFKNKKLKNSSIGIVTRKGFHKINTKTYTSQIFSLKDSTVFYTYLNDFFDALELEDGRIAITSRTGFYLFKPDGTLDFRYDYYTAKDLGSKRIAYGQDIFQISTDELLIYTDRLLAHFNCKTKTYRELEKTSQEFQHFLPSEKNWTIRQQLSQTEYFFLSIEKDSLYYYNSTQEEKIASPLTFSSASELYWASHIFQLNDTSFAINGRYAGVYVFYLNKRNGKITFKNKKQLVEYRCNWLYKDNESRLWIATDNGLLKQKTVQPYVSSWVFYNPKETQANAYFDNVLQINGSLFMSRYAHEDGLCVIDAKTMQLKKTISFFGKSEWNTIISMQKYHADTLWLSCRLGVIWLNTTNLSYGKINLPESLTGIALQLGPPDSIGNAWLCGLMKNLACFYNFKTRDFKLYNSKTKPAFLLSRPKTILSDNKNNTWFVGHGLCRYNLKKDSFDKNISTYEGQNKFEDNITCATADKYGSIWFHAVENGLLRYTIRDEKYEIYTVNNGLPSNVIHLLSPIVEDQLWLGMGQKLVNFNLNSKSITVFDQTDGLPKENFTGSNMFYNSTTKRMYTAMNNRLISFNAVLPQSRPSFKSILVDELIINGDSILYQVNDTLQLQYQQNNLSFKLNVIDYEFPKSYRYFYSLNTLKETALHQEALIHLNNLAPGEHTLLLRAIGKYNQTLFKTISIRIQPPFWQTWWFIVPFTLVLVCLLLLFIRFQFRKMKREGLLNQQLSEFELKALHAQMNPHFIFNCLNSIKALILNNRNQEASQYLSRFSSLVRQNLDHSRKQFLTLQQNIDYIRQYLDIEAIRFTDLNFDIVIAPELDTTDIKIAPMLLQPLIENAIWHGLQSSTTRKNLTVRFKLNDPKIICEIEDNGVGINKTLGYHKEEHTSIGLVNILQRIALLNEKYNLHYELIINDRSELEPDGKGTLVVLSFLSF